MRDTGEEEVRSLCWEIQFENQKKKYGYNKCQVKRKLGGLFWKDILSQNQKTC